MSEIEWEIWHEEQQAKREEQWLTENPDLDYEIENPDEDEPVNRLYL